MMSQLMLALLFFMSWTVDGLPAHISNTNGSCTTDTDCLPANVTPNNLIVCDNSVCLCYPCFQINTTTGRCQLAKCFNYSNTDGTCIDHRPHQKTAFLLSLFLSSFGVANFYTGNIVLALIQLAVTILLIALSVLCFCYCCCLCNVDECCGFDCYDYRDSCWPYVVTICYLTLSVMLVMSIICWWFIDLLVYGFNQRDNGAGCTLQRDL